MPYVAEASNLDDNGDYRPGLRAVDELGVLSPLREIGIDKKTIRALAKEMEIPVWDKPSFACLATRFVYGEQITAEKLAIVEMRQSSFCLNWVFVRCVCGCMEMTRRVFLRGSSLAQKTFRRCFRRSFAKGSNRN